MPLTFPEAATLALIPLTGVVGGYIASLLIANKGVYINSITKGRSEWIEKLRANVATYIAELESYDLSIHLVYGNDDKASRFQIISQADLIAQRKAMEHAALVLQLQLNPRGKIDGNVAKLVLYGVDAAGKSPKLVRKLQYLIIQHSQWLLKAEWEKVKWEALPTWRQLGKYGDEARYKNEYQRWRNNAGNFDSLLTALAAEKSILLPETSRTH